ncbi:lysophospholipase L1-like esterase [Clostridium saccharoperbutylacetonicum]|uniref:Rhamnogalacturonan acetylesterase RhgT n=1 Tax=Clostridium saccharoperbutylacetonicum N1-4(HMT) TaxID=931276 RepID=M1MGE6_9CLOT|nr:rhamnogalacturonan acetylesterase [Clostridium saccharoperbutylacetonicum]AGF55423.1 rhamnogalacturonan acetylesterase RhgT [Clostridium saccharoperbutylacetonicum N1-4(HMT)]NRT63863.1 lysophospholipase L1-like esterase [Clostridium saccharoperbutylacetonicum]NSB27227.1 lysophospholipase L1-like esterase [Clostridium saccharoperbutylacetonicum]NSB40714.1 lysophospholipase L1-like esterase [Clostridium saccharoperbutylacetonicum]
MIKRIFWAGDSTVAQNKIDSYPQTGIGQTLGLYLNEDIVVYNYAKNGRSSKSFVAEGILEKIKKEIEEGDFLFIQFGHNDQKVDKERNTEPYSTYQEYLTKYIEVAREQGAYPVLITSLYRRIFSEDGHIKDEVHYEYPNAMKILGERLEVPVIDLCQKSKALLEKTGDENSKKWFMHLKKGEFISHIEGLEDNTHLKYEGAVIMAELVAEGLQELGGIYKELIKY